MTDRVFLISGIVGTILFPKLSALKGKAEKWEMTRKATFVVGTFLFFLSAGSAAIAKLVLGLLYGKAFLPAVSSFVCLMPGAFFWGISTFPLLYLSSTGLPMQVVWGWAFLTVVNVSLNFFFIPAMGGMGAAIVSTITYGLGFLIFQVYAWKLSRD